VFKKVKEKTEPSVLELEQTAMQKIDQIVDKTFEK
jgi:hypothetical protein